MKKTALALTLMLTILLVTIGQTCNFVRANPIGLKPYYVIVSILSPQNTTYYANPIPLNFTCRTNSNHENDAWCYTLDGNGSLLLGAIWNDLLKVEQKIVGTAIITEEPFHPYTEYTFECNSVLPTLSDGWHNVTVYRGLNSENSHNYYNPHGTVTFRVDTSLSPLPNQSQSPTATPSNPPFPTTWIVAAIAVIAIGAVAFLVYFRKIKKTTGKAESNILTDISLTQIDKHVLAYCFS